MTTVGCTFLQTQFSEWRSQSNIFDSQQPRDNGWTRWSGLYLNTSRPCPGTKTGGYIPQCPRPAVARIDTTHSLALQLRAEILQGPVSVLGAEPDCQPVLAIEADLAGASVNSSLRCLAVVTIGGLTTHSLRFSASETNCSFEFSKDPT